MWTALAEELSNRDWRDLPIVPPHATLAEQLQYRGADILNRLKPIGLQQMGQQKKGSAITLPERVMGFGPAGGYLTNPKATQVYQDRDAVKLWRQKERSDNAMRRNMGLPPLPPRPMPPTQTPAQRQSLNRFLQQNLVGGQ